MFNFYQAKVTLDGVTYGGDCFSGEDFAIRSLITEVAQSLRITFLEAVALVRGKVQVGVL